MNQAFNSQRYYENTVNGSRLNPADIKIFSYRNLAQVFVPVQVRLTLNIIPGNNYLQYCK